MRVEPIEVDEFEFVEIPRWLDLDVVCVRCAGREPELVCVYTPDGIPLSA